VLYNLVPRPLSMSNITSAALFRTVDDCNPTLLMDEGDTFINHNEELRGVINSGHSRRSAGIVRLESIGDQYVPRRFTTWGAKAVALIGTLPSTLEDRAINITMRRCKRDERKPRLPHDETPEYELKLKRMAARWAADRLDALKKRQPADLESLGDRACDNWRPLLAIADELGGHWPDQARLAAEAISGDRELDNESRQTMLLADMKDCFGQLQSDIVSSADATEYLNDLEERPWADLRKGKGISPQWLASKLKPFGIRPSTRREGSKTFKGYHIEDFLDAFERYLPTEPVTPVTSLKQLELDDSQLVTPFDDVTTGW